MAALTYTQVLPVVGMGRFEYKHRGGGARLVLNTSNLTGASGDTVDVPFLADNVDALGKAGVTFTIARNSPKPGHSRITVAGGGTGAAPLKLNVEGRP